MNKTEAHKKTKELSELLSRLGAERNELQLRVNALQTEIDTVYAERQKVCLHKDIEHKSSYYGGSYYDRASTDHWNQCKCCGAKSEVTTKYHSWYG